MHLSFWLFSCCLILAYGATSSRVTSPGRVGCELREEVVPLQITSTPTATTPRAISSPLGVYRSFDLVSLLIGFESRNKQVGAVLGTPTVTMMPEDRHGNISPGGSASFSPNPGPGHDYGIRLVLRKVSWELFSRDR